MIGDDLVEIGKHVLDLGPRTRVGEVGHRAGSRGHQRDQSAIDQDGDQKKGERHQDQATK